MTGGTAGSAGNSSGDGDDGGCSITRTRSGSPTGVFAGLLLGAAWWFRRRRSG
ncbi:MAG: hypothetical protein KC766_14830 [Myxococcales bacterium]|nr:hypothetical protein [Myxococcales bacterium]